MVNKLLEYMTEVDLPVAEMIKVYLITAHSRTGDLTSAEEIFDQLKADCSLAIDEAHIAILCAYAEKGLIDQVVAVSLCSRVT